MQTLAVLFAMNTSLACILAAVVVGLILSAVGRVAIDAVGWYKDHVKDPYRELRQTARGKRKPRKSLEELVSENGGIRYNTPTNVE